MLTSRTHPLASTLDHTKFRFRFQGWLWKWKPRAITWNKVNPDSTHVSFSDNLTSWTHPSADSINLIKYQVQISRAGLKIKFKYAAITGNKINQIEYTFPFLTIWYPRPTYQQRPSTLSSWNFRDGFENKSRVASNNGEEKNPDSTCLLFRESHIGTHNVSSVLDLNRFKFHGRVQKQAK
jgi:hypothetical protein